MSFFLASRLRKASNTVAIEKQRDEFRKDFEEFQAFSQSEELRKFNELEGYVLSDGFVKNRKLIEGKSYKKSDLFREEKDFRRFQKSQKLKTYFRLKDSSELSTFGLMEKSDEIARYQELNTLVHSASFNKKKQSLEFKDWKKMKNSQRIKDFFRFQKSKSYRIYNEVKDSRELREFFQLEERISSDEFQKEKAFLLDKNRFEKTDEFKVLKEYQDLKNSERIKKFFRLKEKNPFEELKKWDLSFSEEFETSGLDRNQWITRYYWGDELLNKGYSQEKDLHAYTDGENVKIKESSAVLFARKEKHQSIVWNSSLGFLPKEFDYTSAVINTGRSFRQKYGRFEAKIKIINPKQLTHSFWMVAEKSSPHIDILKTTAEGHLIVGNFWGTLQALKRGEFKIKGIDLSKGFFIYSLDWTPNQLIWKINDVVVKTQTEGIPNEPMYLNFSLAVNKEQNDLNGSMEIDWVRCYKAKGI